MCKVGRLSFYKEWAHVIKISFAASLYYQLPDTRFCSYFIFHPERWVADIVTIRDIVILFVGSGWTNKSFFLVFPLSYVTQDALVQRWTNFSGVSGKYLWEKCSVNIKFRVWNNGLNAWSCEVMWQICHNVYPLKTWREVVLPWWDPTHKGT